MLPIPIIVLAVVFVLIAVRQIGRFRFQIWQIMLLGAVAVLAAGQISPVSALKAIDWDVILFLFGMFVVGQAMEESGYLAYLSSKLFGRAHSLNILLFLIIFGIGILSAVMMNDTLAIIGTPIMLQIAAKAGIKPKILLLTLAFSVTTGSVMSPIGNPQNLLVAINGNVPNAFITFLRYLALPTIINLFIVFIILKLFYRKEFSGGIINIPTGIIIEPRLAFLSKVSLFVILGLIVLKVIITFAGIDYDFRFTYIALAAAVPVLLSKRRVTILKKVDWFTLIFFAAMFILMQSVWNSGFFQSWFARLHFNLASTVVILGISVFLSQFISNVPLAALYLPVVAQLGAGVREMMALAAGSTIAGNLSILGAASNVIIIQNAERKSGETITFWEFVKIGVPLTALNVFVYWIMLKVL